MVNNRQLTASLLQTLLNPLLAKRRCKAQASTTDDPVDDGACENDRGAGACPTPKAAANIAQAGTALYGLAYIFCWKDAEPILPSNVYEVSNTPFFALIPTCCNAACRECTQIFDPAEWAPKVSDPRGSLFELNVIKILLSL